MKYCEKGDPCHKTVDFSISLELIIPKIPRQLIECTTISEFLYSHPLLLLVPVGTGSIVERLDPIDGRAKVKRSSDSHKAQASMILMCIEILVGAKIDKCNILVYCNG